MKPTKNPPAEKYAGMLAISGYNKKKKPLDFNGQRENRFEKKVIFHLFWAHFGGVQNRQDFENFCVQVFWREPFRS